MFALDAEGEVLMSIEDLLVSPILETAMNAEAEETRELCYKLDWEPVLPSPVIESEEPRRLQFDADIVIIRGETDQQYALASSLSDKLESLTGSRPTTGTLASVATQSEQKLCIFLAELDQPLLANLDAVNFEALQRLLTTVQGILWVVQGAYSNCSNPHANMISGLSRTLRSEGTLMKFITLDFDSKQVCDTDIISSTAEIMSKTLSVNSETEETEFVVRDGSLFTPRILNDDGMNEFVHAQVHLPAQEPAPFLDLDRSLRGVKVALGASADLTFVDDKSLQTPLPDDHVEFQMKSVGINSKDVDAESTIGIECSGIVTAVGSAVPNYRAGDHIAAITPSGSLSTIVRAHSSFVFKIPDHIAFESAAALPLAYSTATYALIEQARLSEGETVLIQDAASAVGQAALSIVQMVGAHAWTTVRTLREKELLMRDFSVPEDKIWHISGETYAESVRDATSGVGVDVVFNTVADSHTLHTAWSCIADFGRFVAVGATHGTITAVPLQKNVTVLSADILALATHLPKVLQRTLSHVARLLSYGKIQPISGIEAFGISEVPSALQNVHATGIHGKAVIVPRDDELVMVSITLPGNYQLY